MFSHPAEKSSAEICKLINRIDGSLAHVKYFVANGRTDSRLEESSIINHLPCEEASRLTLLVCLLHLSFRG